MRYCLSLASYVCICIQERDQARLESAPQSGRVHRPFRGRDVDAGRLELDLYALIHLEPPRACPHARPVRNNPHLSLLPSRGVDTFVL